jgi:hypothetical protein
MKNSAWYPKLWLKKLKEIPLKEDADSSWASMNVLLDQQLPLNAPKAGNGGGNPFGGKWIKLFTYVLPAAMTVGTVAYLIKSDKGETFKPVKTEKSVKPQVVQDTLKNDSLSPVVNILNADTVVKSNLQGLLAAQAKIMPVKAPLITEAAVTTAPAAPVRIALPGVVRLPVNTQIEGLTPANAQPDTDIKILPNLSGFPAMPLLSIADLTEGLARFLVRHPVLLSSERPDIKRQPMSAGAGSTKYRTTKPAQIKNTRSKPIRLKRRKEADSSALNYGLEASSRLVNGAITYGVAAFTDYQLSKSLVLNTGLRFNTSRSFSGAYTHQSFDQPDSLPSFQFTDARKLSVIDIPLNLEYKLSPVIGIRGGPVLSMPIRQFGVKLSSFGLNPDSTSHEQNILLGLKQTKVNKINLGFGIGLSFHFGHLDLNTRYEFLKPYVFSNELGTYRKSYQGIQIGLGYRFK